ncbi:MAG: hypothetical protein OJF52_004314 [Nitrospira sp.]|jgi:hypothetical protein|nr:MAG: hypothetical protein OJF52_004314 [Nitrospira sp.]
MDKQTWQFINSFAPWFSALGTISAVIASLYLATKTRRLHIKVTASLNTLVQTGMPSRDYVTISAVNLGAREVTITGIGWSLPFKRTKLFQIPGAPEYSSKLPVRLRDGESANFYVSAKPGLGDENWIPSVKDYLGTAHGLKVHFLRAQVHTSVGKTFYARPDRHIRNLLTGKETDQ